MRHFIKYIIVGILASLLGYVAFSVFLQNIILVCCISLTMSIVLLFVLRKIIQTHNFSFVLMVSVFLFVLLVPLLGKKETTSLEKRTLSEFPKFDINYVWGFTYGLADYINDRFAYRNTSISFLGKLKYEVFHESPMPNLVEIGKGNMLFYSTIEYVNEISEPFTSAQLDTLKTNMEIMTKWFDSKGIKYYITVPPGKDRIYPELMSIGLQYRTQFSKLDQLYNYIKNDTLIRFIDYRKELIDNKKTRLTYQETDSHWNMFGAYFAYQKITQRMKKDFPQINVAELSDYKMDSTISVGGDLQRHLGFDDLFTSHFYQFTPKNNAQPITLDSSKYDRPDAHVEIFENPKTSTGNISACPLKLFVDRDSYMGAPKMFFITQFRHSFFVWAKSPRIDLIMQEHPDVVLDEVLERYVNHFLYLPDEIRKDSVFIKQNFPNYYKIKKGI